MFYFLCSVIPSLLEYFSYNFCFLTFLAGPTVAYKEYDEFITGRNITEANNKQVSCSNHFILYEMHWSLYTYFNPQTLQFEGLKFEGFCQPYRDACEIVNVSCVASQLSLTQEKLRQGYSI